MKNRKQSEQINQLKSMVVEDGKAKKKDTD